VSTLADEGNYGEKGIGEFENRALKSGKCHVAVKNMSIRINTNYIPYYNLEKSKEK